MSVNLTIVKRKKCVFSHRIEVKPWECSSSTPLTLGLEPEAAYVSGYPNLVFSQITLRGIAPRGRYASMSKACSKMTS